MLNGSCGVHTQLWREGTQAHIGRHVWNMQCYSTRNSHTLCSVSTKGKGNLSENMCSNCHNNKHTIWYNVSVPSGNSPAKLNCNIMLHTTPLPCPQIQFTPFVVKEDIYIVSDYSSFCLGGKRGVKYFETQWFLKWCNDSSDKFYRS